MPERMRRSLSARILLGFTLVLIAFAVVLGLTIVRMQGVRSQLELINSRYLRLILILGELDKIQNNLNIQVAERKAGRGTSKFLRRQVTLARQARLLYVKKALRVIGSEERLRLAPRDAQLSVRARERLRQLAEAFRRHEPTLDRLFTRGGEALTGKTLEHVGEALLRQERKLERDVLRQLQRELRARVKSVGRQVEAYQRTSIWAGLAMILAALVLSIAVTLRVRRWLGPLTVLVGGTKRIASGDYSERVEVDSGDELGLLAGEFNKMAEAIEEREQRLIRSERLAAAGRLASHITHEVRNPLNSISLNTELLEEELAELPQASRDEAQSILRAVQHEIDRLTGITEEYLQFARLPKPNLDDEDLDTIVGSLLTFLGGELAQNDVVLVQQLAGDLPPIAVDENQIRQALLNLLRNAIEAMAGSGGELTVETRQLSGDDSPLVEVRVTDQGPGIDPDVLAQVYEPFFSTKDGGTGLGLALTQQIIHEHGGRISVESQRGQGTTFVVSLPASADSG
jgi:two-component system NtrC family sensor kinase